MAIEEEEEDNKAMDFGLASRKKKDNKNKMLL